MSRKLVTNKSLKSLYSDKSFSKLNHLLFNLQAIQWAISHNIHKGGTVEDFRKLLDKSGKCKGHILAMYRNQKGQK